MPSFFVVAQTDEKLKLFLDCPDGCDSDYVREQVKWVDYVTDRTVADVHILVTSAQTGSGGREYTLSLIGLGKLDTIKNEVKFLTPQGATDAEIRDKAIRYYKISLVPFLMKSNADKLSVNFSLDPSQLVNNKTVEQDKWNKWVFSTEFGTWSSAEERQSTVNLNGSFSAKRISEKWISKVGIYQGYNRQKNTYGIVRGNSIKDTTTVGERTSLEAWTSASYAIAPKLTIGGGASFRKSSFNNTDSRFSASMGIEKSFLPYEESQRKMLRLKYSLGVEHADYTNKTIYGKDKEFLYTHTGIAATSFVQPWGNVFVAIIGEQYLNHPSQYEASIWSGVSWRVAKGLEVGLGGNYTLVENQRSLADRPLTQEEILRGTRELPTKFRTSISANISYTFGAILNNIVNNRWRISGGGNGFSVSFE